jgi:histidinol-phosphatase
VQHDALESRLKVALDAAARSGDLAMSLYQSTDLAVERKSDGSPVTSADKDGEALIRRMIAEAFPDDGVMGEEHPEKTGVSGWRWIIDPIDGTNSFVRGVPTFGVLIGVERNGAMAAGVAHFPALDETVWALEGGGAWWKTSRGETIPARVSEADDLGKSLVQSPSPPAFVRYGRDSALAAITKAVHRTHGWNDAYSFALAATGRADAVIGFKFSLWDVAPFMIIFSEAGGLFTAWDGTSPAMATALGAGPGLHGSLARLLSSASNNV